MGSCPDTDIDPKSVLLDPICIQLPTKIDSHLFIARHRQILLHPKPNFRNL